MKPRGGSFRARAERSKCTNSGSVLNQSSRVAEHRRREGFTHEDLERRAKTPSAFLPPRMGEPKDLRDKVGLANPNRGAGDRQGAGKPSVISAGHDSASGPALRRGGSSPEEQRNLPSASKPPGSPLSTTYGLLEVSVIRGPGMAGLLRSRGRTNTQSISSARTRYIWRLIARSGTVLERSALERLNKSARHRRFRD